MASPDCGTITDQNLGPLCDPARLASLGETGLGATSSPEMEAIAAQVRRWLDVPVALVSLVTPDQQVFPGMAGLPQPWAAKRSTPLTHSFCQHVVAMGAPLIVHDARDDQRVRDNLAVAELGVVAYAGMPLSDTDGHVLGSLCAIDVVPRRWTERELDDLRYLALVCSTDLRLRLALVDANRERLRRDELERAMQNSIERTQTLLVASRAMTRTITVDEVRDQVSVLLVGTDLQPCYVGLSVLDDRGRVQRIRDELNPLGAAGGHPWSDFEVTARIPSATAIREHRIVHYPDRPGFDAEHDEPIRAWFREFDLHTAVAAPLQGTDTILGSIVLGWDTPQRLGPHDLLLVATIASYAAQALDRAQQLQHRIDVADQMQRAMLTTLPTVNALEMAARYRPADAREAVGGDWYDAALLPDPEHPDSAAVAVSVGDILGHSLDAVVIMGQVRTMLRQAAWDHPAGHPSLIMSSFETAAAGLGIGAAGTAVVAHLHRAPGDQWSMTWTNAGHPPPILIRPDGTAELLAEHGPLFGYPGVDTTSRPDHHIDLPAGSLLLLYSDGLVERPGIDIDTGIANVARHLAGLRDRPIDEVVDALMERLPPSGRDDVISFALRFGAG